MPPKTIEVYFDDVVLHCPVIRALQLANGLWELLIRVGNGLEYDYIKLI